MDFGLEAWRTLLGRLHVGSVHFPIALLLVAGVLDWLERRRPSESLAATVRTLFRLAAPAALVAAGLGWIHADAEPLGSSVARTLWLHRWLGVACTVLACIAALGAHSAAVRKLCGWPAALLVVATGHFGGALVFGGDYYTAPFRSERDAASEAPSAPSDAERAPTFAADARPVLEALCTECHGEKKHKGDLRLDRYETAWFTPGEYATTIVPSKPDESELLRRMLLPLDDDDHMPPPKKRQPSAADVEVLRRWIEHGAQP